MPVYTFDKLSEIRQSEFTVISFLRQFGILKEQKNCHKCGTGMSFVSRRKTFVWKCKKGICRRSSGLLAGTYFYKCRLPLRTLILLIHTWAMKFPAKDAFMFVGIPRNTAVNWYRLLQDVCSWKMLQAPIKLGGPGKVVQVDVNAIVKTKSGRKDGMTSQWVFRMYDCTEKYGFMTFVAKKDAATLLSVITEHVLPESTVVTHLASMYSGLDAIPNMNYAHLTINRSENFVDRTTGAHLNAVVGYWSRAKKFFHHMNGSLKNVAPSYLHEFMWRDRYGKNVDAAFENMFHHIREYQDSKATESMTPAQHNVIFFYFFTVY
ncbi:uncharacterized protein LOC122799563 [Protopterus annectens]|uniref:uncharacterized protein LOC122799563 n=1 Tax=Protopterus annectens TaxID=7888 RepID=UPI001CFC03B8|nr:uncharacterized protein LOC122799563 [Protopterus annectens]XP_043924643.1 uncharacterized protein LOC122799563 [Protopterus annectens]